MKKLVFALLLSTALWAQEVPSAVALLVHPDRPAWAGVTSKPNFVPYVLVLFEAAPNTIVTFTAYADDTSVATTSIAVATDPPVCSKVELPLQPSKPLPDRVEISIKLSITGDVELDAPF